jgi:hypothetical protein
VTRESEARLKVYDLTRDFMTSVMPTLDEAGREIWCEQYLASALSVAREYCPDRAAELARRAGLDVALQARRPQPLRRRLGAAFRRFRAGLRPWSIVGLFVAISPYVALGLICALAERWSR